VVGYRYNIGLIIASFAMSFIFLAGGIFLQLSGLHSSSTFCMLSLPFNYIGVLATWFCRSVVQQSARLDKLEAQLRERDIQ
jgi:hypothetical protein